jgi:hypothetical protein
LQGFRAVVNDEDGISGPVVCLQDKAVRQVVPWDGRVFTAEEGEQLREFAIRTGSNIFSAGEFILQCNQERVMVAMHLVDKVLGECDRVLHEIMVPRK